MNIKVDARGMQCPKPVIETKKAFDSISDGVITTVVDNEIARENVKKLAGSMNYEVNIEEIKGDFYLNINKGKTSSLTISKEKGNQTEDFVILIGKDTMGSGDDTLGNILMKGYIYTLTETKPYPKAILFVNSGIKLTIDSSEVLDHLTQLKESGVELLSCGTCLDFYGYKDNLAIGEVTNMYNIVEMTNTAGKTITI